MILLYGHGPSVEAEWGFREPSHPVSAAGRESRRWESYEGLMRTLREEIQGNRKKTLIPGVDDKFGKCLKTKTMWRVAYSPAIGKYIKRSPPYPFVFSKDSIKRGDFQ